MEGANDSRSDGTDLLMATDAARLVSTISGVPISGDGLKLHDRVLQPERTSRGVRLYRRDRLVRFAEVRGQGRRS